MKTIYPLSSIYRSVISPLFFMLKSSFEGTTHLEVPNVNFNAHQASTKTTAQHTIKNQHPNFETETIKLKLEDYNHKLDRSLKTLEYVQLMENRTDISKAKLHFSELFKLKSTIEEQIIKATEKISYYKLLLETSRA